MRLGVRRIQQLEAEIKSEPVDPMAAHSATRLIIGVDHQNGSVSRLQMSGGCQTGHSSANDDDITLVALNPASRHLPIVSSSWDLCILWIVEARPCPKVPLCTT